MKCSQALDQAAAQSADLGPAKFCPICVQARAEEGGGRHGSSGDGDDEAPPVEQFPNQMLDAVTTRMRAKTLDVQALLNYVLGIFDKGGKPLPGSDALRAPPASAAPAAAAPPPVPPPKKA